MNSNHNQYLKKKSIKVYSKKEQWTADIHWPSIRFIIFQTRDGKKMICGPVINRFSGADLRVSMFIYLEEGIYYKHYLLSSLMMDGFMD